MPTLHWLETSINDMVSLLISGAMLFAYHFYLRVKLRTNAHYTFQSVTHAARIGWVAGIMEDESRAVLGVQTLRNSIMAATFFASTAVLLMMGTLTLSGQADKLTASWQQLDLVGSIHPGVWIAKILFLLSDLIIAFFNFAMAARLFHHVGYLLNVPPEKRPNAVTPRSVAIHLNRAGRYYSIGMRSYYFAVPLVFWLFGPHFMILATLVLIVVLYRVDRAPRNLPKAL